MRLACQALDPNWLSFFRFGAQAGPSLAVICLPEAYKPVADTLNELLALEASPWFKFVHPDAKSTMNTVKDFLTGLAERRSVAAAIALVLHKDFYKQMVRMAAGFVK